jgi:hypothetical protein
VVDGAAIPRCALQQDQDLVKVREILQCVLSEVGVLDGKIVCEASTGNHAP